VTARRKNLTKYFVVGDVHGCAHTLAALVARAGEDRRIVLLGDYVDRGPNVRMAVDLVRAWVNSGKAVALKGNHEDMMARAILGGPAGGPAAALDAWIGEGGDATLDGYGSDRRALVDDATFLAGLPAFHLDPPYLLSHAGVPPDGTIQEAERSRVILWNRGWLSDEWEQVVGHTPAPEPIVHPGRWAAIDTGAYVHGVLTAILLPEWEVVQQRVDPRDRRDEPDLLA
jgi:serine/threonine protein phosphatase 1